MKKPREEIELNILRYFAHHLNETIATPVSCLSETNNLVYKVVGRSGKAYVFKVMLDRDIDVAFLRESNIRVSASLLTQKILHIDQSKRVFDADIVIAEFCDGMDAAAMIESGVLSRYQQSNLLDFYWDLAKVVRNLKLPTAGFGVYKNRRPMHATFESYMHYFIDRYTNRFSDAFSSEEDWSSINKSLKDYFRLNIGSGQLQFDTISVDSNLKNIFYSSQHQAFMVVNLPILSYGDFLQGLGEITSNLDHTTTAQFLERVHAEMPLDAESRSHILFYETLSLIGKLAFYCKDGWGAVRSAKTWGYQTSFLDRIRINMKQLQHLH
jgi:hypothetical protein